MRSRWNDGCRPGVGGNLLTEGVIVLSMQNAAVTGSDRRSEGVSDLPARPAGRRRPRGGAGEDASHAAAVRRRGRALPGRSARSRAEWSAFECIAHIVGRGDRDVRPLPMGAGPGRTAADRLRPGSVGRRPACRRDGHSTGCSTCSTRSAWRTSRCGNARRRSAAAAWGSTPSADRRATTWRSG